MPNTLNNVVLPAGTWVDLYASSAIAVGTKIRVQNLTPSYVRLCTKATAPTSLDGFNALTYGDVNVNQAADSGAWAMSTSGGAVNVSIV
ncbi:hypothetical protein phiPLPE_31 [Iodobacter phage PhiPLPE]|uniref:Uncharacterized protein n=1 Tax=Iodobacter phage PhiPLPE TaxID=551895 RepID=B5AX50_9CAUD|nr:hypothetical protein phiPLPE_31 [Iodobacter phage PhiPLPE]ACG60353.1 hypothetical protein phiPLPE_31 [Iodobacter phage PhiPLPE]